MFPVGHLSLAASIIENYGLLEKLQAKLGAAINFRNPTLAVKEDIKSDPRIVVFYLAHDLGRWLQTLVERVTFTECGQSGGRR